MNVKNPMKRLLSLALVACMLLAYVLPANAVSTDTVKITQVDNGSVVNPLDGRIEMEEEEETPAYKDTDMVRVSIVLKDKSTIEAGYSTQGIAANKAAMTYRDKLENTQTAVAEKISARLGGKLDVVWNLTLAANIISANVEYGQIKTIEKTSGVDKVFIENRYEPDVVDIDRTAEPNMGTSGAQIGSSVAWASGYTGAGSRIAIIDTGTDTLHQSFDAAAFEYSLSVNAEKAGMSLEAYMESLDLLDAEEIAAVADKLNVKIDPEQSYVNSKIPFGYNYIDRNYDVSHTAKDDYMGEHGSHVSGIAAANAYVPNGDGTYSSALEKVFVQGVAPDAQVITMKVFGVAGGAYDSDYMVAIEDAVLLGCDSVNLSLGGGNPGYSREVGYEYQRIMDNLIGTGVVVAMSAGNSGSWVERAGNLGYLYTDDVSMDTVGSPGSYTNSMAVASVDNDGAIGYSVTVGDVSAVYNEPVINGYNYPLTSIARDEPYEYVLIDGMGYPEDWAAAGDLTGKIAICPRGDLTFYEKATYAVEAGAAATIIYNNVPGVIDMDMSSYRYSQPCVGITQDDGEAIKAISTPVTDETGKVVCYTGEIVIDNSFSAGLKHNAYYTMSSFSSWGIPGSLELKPDITAPGGGIYSVFGAIRGAGGGDQYELMSGTSMASPQIAGMAALLAQYLRETGLAEQEGLTNRVLAQSLLMSTAVPMKEEESDYYYPVIQQGAGLGNVGAAVNADSYILMGEDATESAADGKVKVELGDDPEKTGEYTFSFSVNNLTDVDKAYVLSADIFTQNVFEYYATGSMREDQTALYMDTLCAALEADVVFAVNGKPLEASGDLTGLDFNGDGTVNTGDGQALLDYATGLRTELTNEAKADLDADGDIDSYDAYLFFSMLDNTLVVPAFGSVDVSVSLTLTEEQKETLEYLYPEGAYIEGYVFVKGVSSEEGVAGTVHSIPVLGFYGCWSDPSMFDVGNHEEYRTGEEYRLPYLGTSGVNGFGITYGDQPNRTFFFGGNPMVADSYYMPERNAFNSENDNMIALVQYAPIRNGAASRFTAVNTTTGETLEEEYYGPIDSAFYYPSYGAWFNVKSTMTLEFIPKNVSNGDQLELAFTLAPEYYVDEVGNVDWDALGHGASLYVPVVVDNIAPELVDFEIDLENMKLYVTASDNQYVSAVALYNKSGTVAYSYTGSKQDIEPGEEAEYVLDLSEVNGRRFLLQVTDYAKNATTYLIETQIGEIPPMPEMIAFNLTQNHWTTLTKDSDFSNLSSYMSSDLAIYAATIVNHMVLASTAGGDLYVAPEDDLGDLTFIGNMGASINDMAYNKADGNVYGVADNTLYVIDKLTGELTAKGWVGITTNTLACDANGTFYCNEYGTGKVYTFTLDTLGSPELFIREVGILSADAQSMEINPNTGMLCWISYSTRTMYSYSYYYEIDPTTGAFYRYNDLMYHFTSLIIPDKTGDEGDDSWMDPTDEVSGIYLSESSVTTLRGGTETVTATVQPWTASDRSVIWSSADESIAVVDNRGVVTGVMPGTTTITATSRLDPSVSASCTVVVEAVNVTVKGLLQDTEGKAQFFNWNLETDETWTAGNKISTSIACATYSPESELYYVSDAQNGVWGIHALDKDGNQIGDTGYNPLGASVWDSAYSSYYSELKGTDMVAAIYSTYFLIPQNPLAVQGGYMDLSSRVSYLTAITSVGYEPYEDLSTHQILDTEHFIFLDDAGKVWNFWVSGEGFDMVAYLTGTPSNLNFVFNGYSNMTYMFTSMVVGDDGCLYVSAFSRDTNYLFRLTYDPAAGIYNAEQIGNFGEDVYPAVLTEVTTNDGSEATAFAAPKATEKITAQPLTEEVLASLKAPEGNAAAMDAKVTVEPKKTETPAARLAEPEAFKPGTVITPLADSTVGEGENTVTVTVTAKDAAGAEVDSTNGVATVTFDADALTLTGVTVNGDYSSVNRQTGSVTFGYVDLEGIPAGETVATLTFEVKSTEDTQISVTYEEVNNEAGGIETGGEAGSKEDIPVNYEHPNTEVRDAKEADCENKGYTGDTYCLDCGELVAKGEEIPATGHSYKDVVTEPTTESEGYTTHTCENCGHSYKDTFTDKLPVEGPGNADTGDTFMAGLWITVMAVCAAGLAVLVFNRKKLFNT